MAAILEQIMASGMASGEFPLGDATLAARLVNTACIRFSHPRLIVEFEQVPEPTLDQMIGFCLTALTRQPVEQQQNAPGGVVNRNRTGLGCPTKKPVQTGCQGPFQFSSHFLQTSMAPGLPTNRFVEND
jgi:hypothetical protein